MGNDGGAVGRNFGGGGAATAKDHQANIIPSGAGGAVATAIGPIKGGNVNLSTGGQVNKADEARWVRSGGKEGRAPNGGIRSKAQDIAQKLNRDAFGNAGLKRMNSQTKVSRINTRQAQSLSRTNSYKVANAKAGNAAVAKLRVAAAKVTTANIKITASKFDPKTGRQRVTMTVKPHDYKGVNLRGGVPRGAGGKAAGARATAAQGREARGRTPGPRGGSGAPRRGGTR